MDGFSMDGRGLLGRCESGELYFGPQSDTPEKRRALLEPAMLSFARSIRKNHPEILKQIAKESERKEGKRNA